jgi:hypothetical protein
LSRKSRFPHRRHPAFLAWLRTYPCVLCGNSAEPAHVKSRGAGGDDIGNTVPLCRTHHREQHDTGIQSFARKYGIDLAQVAAGYGEAFTQGVV